ncbi:MAG: glycosyltransferase family 1 protein [Caulobacteraceae bacterium]|nr:glycosyltransferase family 1 protein [Caulobacteraceae bacterium]
MRVLILAHHYPVASGRYAAAAFAALGHEVITWGPAHGRDVWGLRLPAGSEWTPTLGSDPAALATAAPNLVVVMDSAPDVLDAAQVFNSAPVPVCVWGVDNHVRDYRRGWFDQYFLAHRGPSLMPWAVDMTHLPCAHDPAAFHASEIPFAERSYDVAMIGVMYEQRWAAVNALKSAGLKVIAGAGLMPDASGNVYRDARVSLCLSAAGDVAQRVFETAACGCVLVSDYCADLDALKPDGATLRDCGIVLVPAHEPAAIVDTVRDVLADADSALLASSAATWAAPHTWQARASIILDWAE